MKKVFLLLSFLILMLALSLTLISCNAASKDAITL